MLVTTLKYGRFPAGERGPAYWSPGKNRSRMDWNAAKITSSLADRSVGIGQISFIDFHQPRMWNCL
jgi:hypothetical protein